MSIAEKIKVLTLEYTELNRENQKMRARLGKLQDDIAKLKQKQALDMPSVTDHALLRLAERKYGVNVQQLKDEILCKEVKEAIKVGAKRIKINGMEYVLNNGLVVTVLN